MNEWSGGNLLSEHTPPPNAYTVVDDLDFFRLEYGKPVEPFGFVAGADGWTRKWGTEGRERDKPAARFGRGWDGHPHYNFCLEMEIEQDKSETAWEFLRYCRFGYRSVQKTPFTVKGTGRQTFRLPLGPIGTAAQHWVNGIALVCKTAGAQVKVSRLVIAPFVCEVSWRRRFTLDEKPWRGGVSYRGLADFTLSVNGTVVSRGRRFAIGGTRRDDITAQLKAGENEILFTGNFNSTYGPNYRFLINAFAVSAAGRTTVIPGDGQWEWRYAGDPEGRWRKPKVFGTAGLAGQPNGNLYATGGYPLHPGPLDPKPAGASRYPIFTEGEKIAWTVALPPDVKSPVVTTEVCDAVTGQAFPDGFAGLKTGAYRVTWRLFSGGKEIDRTTKEMVVVGKLDLPEAPLREVKAETEKRQRLVTRIDCTANEANPSNFIDHSNWYGDVRLNVGRVTDRPSGRYRETGSSAGDLFAYRIAVGEVGRPHILEFDYPDDAERMIYCAVLDSIAMAFCNNTPPEGYKSWPSGTCGVRCGGLMPLSGEKRTQRVLFFPASKVNTVYFENGLAGTRAAVSEIRVYAIDGDLPVPPPAETGRLYGNHNERPLMHHWGAFVTPLIHEYEREDALGKWTAAYWSVANRIRQLRHFGQNCSIEGGYMYSSGFPSQSGVCDNVATDFDYNELILRMYKANGITAFLGYEYSGAPDVVLSGVRGVGDRENWEGTARPGDQVDRYGRQISGHGMAVNAFCPVIWASALRAAREMYERYAPLGVVKGVVAQTGWLWMPSFGRINGDVEPHEVGYDDDTIEAFERDTGIRVDEQILTKRRDAASPNRFAKRYELLTGRHRDAWFAWRRQVMAKKLAELAAQCRGTYGDWSFWTSPCTDGEPTEADYAGTDIRVLPKIPYGKELQLDSFIRGFGREARAGRRNSEQVYLAPTGLNERNFTQLNRASGWWWQTSRCVVFETKPSGPNALYDVTLVVADKAPRTLFHTWLDVNIPTGNPDEERTAAYRFYEIPEGKGEPCPEIRGITARRVGDRVTLVNATPYGLVGRLTLSGAKSVSLAFEPFEFRTMAQCAPGLAGAFALDERGSAIVRGQRTYLDIAAVRKNLSADCLKFLGHIGEAALGEAASRRFVSEAQDMTDYDLAVALRDPEMLAAVRQAFGADGVSKYVNGQAPERYVRDGTVLVDWQAGRTNAEVKAAFPRDALQKENGVAFMRLRTEKGACDFRVAEAKDTKRPNGIRTFEARVRLHGTNAFLQVFAPWKSRFDVRLKSGWCLPGAVAWPSDNRFHAIDLDERHALPTDEWFDFACRIDPQGEATLFVNGFLMAHVDLMRLHGDRIKDDYAVLYGSFSSKDDPTASVDIQDLRLVYRP